MLRRQTAETTPPFIDNMGYGYGVYLAPFLYILPDSRAGQGTEYSSIPIDAALVTRVQGAKNLTSCHSPFPRAHPCPGGDVLPRKCPRCR